MIRHVAGAVTKGEQRCFRCNEWLAGDRDDERMVVGEGDDPRMLFWTVGVHIVHEGGFMGIAREESDVPLCEPVNVEGVDIV